MLDPHLQQFIQGTEQFMQATKVQMDLMQRSVAALQAESLLRTANRTPRMDIEFVSQFGEDRFAWTLLGKQTTGFFIEAGAFDGYHLSVTYALEAMGWNGLLVEAIPDRYRDCVARRPNSRVVNAVLSSDGATGEAEFMVMQDQAFSYSLSEERKVTPVAGQDRSVRIPRATLNQLLADHQGPIDLVLLDLEGDEVAALKGFDLARFRPRVLIIEDNTLGNNEPLKAFMQNQPYLLGARVAINEVYIRNDEPGLMAALQRISKQGF
jgi:FkbM family methyltransferase